MKETKNINLGGQAFTIDHDAYNSLQEYLDALEKHFVPEDAAEVLQDIEMRVAELFNERLQNGKNVISQADVDEIISQLGKPSDFDDEPTADNRETASTTREERKKNRRLFRDGDNMMIGGVCSGIANYLHLDVVIIRLITVAALLIGSTSVKWFDFSFNPFHIFSFIFPLYLILWIIVPKAKSTAEKLQMKGEEPSLENISQYSSNHTEAPVERRGCLGFFLGFLKACMIALGVFFGGIFLICVFAAFVALLIAPFVLIVESDNIDLLSTYLPHMIILGLSMLVFIVSIIAALIGLLVHFSRRRSNPNHRPNKAGWITCLIAFLLSLVGLFITVNNKEFRTDLVKCFKDVYQSERLDYDDDDEDYDDSSMASEEDDLEAFKDLNVTGNFRITYTESDQPHMIIRYTDQQRKRTSWDITNGTLSLKYKVKNGKKSRPVLVELQGPSFHSANITGGASLTLSQPMTREDEFSLWASSGGNFQGELIAPSVNIEASSGADCSITMTTDKLWAETSSGANVTLIGSAKGAELEASSGSQILASGLSVEELEVESSSAAHIEANATKTATLEATSGSYISFWGPAKVTKSASSGGNIKTRD